MTTALDISLAQADTEVTDAAHALTMEDVRVGILADAHTTLSQVAVTLEALVSENKAMSPVLADSCQQALSAVTGGAVSASAVSLESYQGGPEQQTALSLESVKETLANVFEKFKLAIKRAIKAVSDFVSKLFGGVRAVEKKVKNLDDRCRALKKKGVKSVKGTMSVPYAHSLAYRGVVSQKAIAAGTNDVYRKLYQSRTTLAGAVGAMYKQANSLMSNIANMTYEDFVKISGEFKLVAGRVQTNEELPGGKHLTFTAGEVFGGNFITNIKIEDYKKAKNPPSAAEIDIPDLDWVQQQTTLLGKFVDQFQKDARTENIEQLNDARLKAVDKLDRIITMNESGAANDKQVSVKTLKFAMWFYQRDFAASLVRIDHYTFRHARALTSLLDNALSELEKTVEAE